MVCLSRAFETERDFRGDRSWPLLVKYRSECLVRSLELWPAFADTTEALSRLAGHFRLAVVSNIDDDLFPFSARQLGVAMDEVITAEQVGSYKPNPAHFHEALRRLELPRDRVLHVAQSLFHDIGPANALGFETVWVNRRAGAEGFAPVKNAAGKIIRRGEPITHFNEVDECAGLDGLFTNRVHKALGQQGTAPETHLSRGASWRR